MNNSKLTDKITYYSTATLTSIKFDNDILKIIRSLYVNKEHGHDGISVRMIKMHDESMIQPLPLTDTGVYPDAWKKSNIAGFDLTTRDLYFTILLEVFTNHFSAENT